MATRASPGLVSSAWRPKSTLPWKVRVRPIVRRWTLAVAAAGPGRIGTGEDQQSGDEGEQGGRSGADDPGTSHAGGVAVSPPSSLNCVLSSR